MNWKSAAAVLLLVTLARAQSNDASTPQAAAKSLAAAIARGDGDSVRNLIFVENDPEQQLVNTYANLILAAKRLSETAKKRYPGVATPFTSGGIAPEEAASIDAAQVQLSEETAVLRIQGREKFTRLRKINGTWKVIVSEEPADQTPEHRAEQVARVQALADALNGCADDIAAGKFRDVQEARNAVKDRLGAVAAKMLQTNPPTSSPTTQPEVR
jgi:hypothetical protein